MVDEFRLRPGKPGDRGAAGAKRFTSRLRKAAKQLAKPRGKKRYSGVRSGRGVAAARMATIAPSAFAKHRMRRVIVKNHIARATKGIGKAAFRAHLKYIQRDGVDRAETAVQDVADEEVRERDARRAGRLYDRHGDVVDDRSFLARSAEDRHQFRVIVSPEDGDQLGCLKDTTRSLMAEVERDLGTRLDWVGVDHHNTGHPHTHIVIRGKDARGADLVIARDYLTKGMRARAEAVIMERLGPRRDLEIARAQANEVGAERFTGIDRGLRETERGGVVSIETATSPSERFQRRLAIRRLTTLERLGLAARLDEERWRLVTGWEEALKTRGRQGDIIRSLAAASGRDVSGADVNVFDVSAAGQPTVTGRVLTNTPLDELRDKRALNIETLDGKVWHVPVGERAPGALPPAGAIVAASPGRARPRPADHTIAEIAARHQGRYSADLHQAHDPSAGTDYIEAHKRRLEALRRLGQVTRLEDGAWAIGQDFLKRAAAYEQARAGARVTVLSWIDLEAQTRATAPTWLDQAPDDKGLQGAFADDLRNARLQRAAFLKANGLWSRAHQGFDPAEVERLAAAELTAAGGSEAARSGRTYRALDTSGRFDGVYERPVDLAGGRFALVGHAKEFTLVPWRPALERHRGGAMLSLTRRQNGVSWTLGRMRGPSR